MTYTVGASGLQIHAQASLVLIEDWVQDVQQMISRRFGSRSGDRAAAAVGLDQLNQLEDRMEWSLRDLIRWEQDKGFDANAELTRRRRRVGPTFDAEDAIEEARLRYVKLREGR